MFAARPDLGYPVPRDLAEVTVRAATSASVGRALDRLDAFTAVVAEGLAALPGPASVEAVADLVHAPVDSVRVAAQTLRGLALAWDDDSRVQLVRAVRESFGPYPGGLAPPSAVPLSPTEIAQRLGRCDPGVQPVLDRLIWSPAGRVRHADRAVEAESARSPVEQLLAAGLLRPLDPATVLLPREVAEHLRQGRFTPEAVADTPPAVPANATPDPDRVDRAAAGAAYELVGDLESVVEALERMPVRRLREGGVASRDLVGLARALDLTAARTALVIEVAAAAGLVAGDVPGRLLPTAAFDTWAHCPTSARWQAAAEAWRDLPRLPGQATEPGGHALGPEGAAPATAADLRTWVLRLAASAGPAARIDPTGLPAVLRWHQPRFARLRSPDLDTRVVWAWREATAVGLFALGAVSGYAPVLVAGGPLPEPLAALFPGTQESVLLQADLTAVAPGPLPTSTARELRQLADRESRGGAGVFRFSRSSLRRALEAGWSAAEVHNWLARHAATPVPQPLQYLVDDVARDFGRLRIGVAGCFLRVDDPATWATLLRMPEAAALGLREVAPGVLVALAEPEDLARALQRHGHAPALEDASGRVVASPSAPRAPGGAPQAPSRPTPREAAEAVRRGETTTGVPAATPMSSASDDIVALLASATAEARAVQVGYVAADGAAYERELAPLDLGAGTVRGIDRRTAAVVSIPLARISSVRWP